MKALLLGLSLAAATAGGSEITAKVPVPGTPCGVAGAAEAVWVTEPLFGKLLRIDPATNTITKQVATDQAPCELKFAAGSLWVVTQSGRLDRFDPKTMRRLASIPVGATTYDLTYALRSIWITNRNGGTVQRISPVSNRVLKTVTFPAGVAPAGIGYAAGALWVGDDHGNSVFRLDPRTYRWTRVRSGGQAASWIAVNGTDVWVSNTKSGTVTRIDARTRKATATLKIGTSPVNLDAIGGDIWVPDDVANTIVRIDGDTGRIAETIATAEGPGGGRRSRGRRLGVDVRRLAGLADPPGGMTVRRLVLLPLAVGLVTTAGAGASLPAPSIAGPRQTTSQEPVYTFGAKGAARYVCAFDSTRLHACMSPYSEWLTVGTHVLRVQAVGGTGRSPSGERPCGSLRRTGSTPRRG